MTYLEEHFNNVDCDAYGNVYKNGILAKQCNSNGYKQVTLRDKYGKRRICGVHCVVAMKYLNYFDGCIVHHKDKNRHNNHLSNLEVLSDREHKHHHGLQNETFKNRNKGKCPWNKGKKMSEDFCKHCKDAAKHRASKFNGNQYVKVNK